MAHTLTLASFPDYFVITEGDLIAEGDKVVERWTCGGTFTGAPYFGTPVTGKRFSVTGISIYRIARGKIVEHWAEADFLGAAQQLGVFCLTPRKGKIASRTSRSCAAPLTSHLERLEHHNGMERPGVSPERRRCENGLIRHSLARSRPALSKRKLRRLAFMAL